MSDFIQGTDGQTDYATLHSVESALRGLTEEEKRLIAVSTISVVSRLAVEFEEDEVRLDIPHSSARFYDIFLQVTRLTVSMFLQHLRSAEPTVEAVIAYNLVDLALCAPENAFVDIIRAFSAINRTANPDDPRLSNNMVCYRLEVLHFRKGLIILRQVLAAQTRLAQQLNLRPNLYEVYITELLTLFVDKGVAVQNVAVSAQSAKVCGRILWLASLY